VSYFSYNIKELAVALVLTDAKGGIAGPTYGPKVEWEGAQKIGLNINQNQVELLGNGLILDAQSSLDKADVSIEAGLITPEIEALIYQINHSEKPDATEITWHEDSGNAYVGVWAKTDQVGANGEDLVMFLPRVQFASRNTDQAQRAYRTNQYSASAVFTKSSFPLEEIVSGVLTTVYKKIIFMESQRRVAASLFTRSTTPLTVLTSNITSHPVANNIVIQLSASLKRATVNKYTVLFTLTGTPVACAISLSTDDNDDDTITINPTVNLTGSSTYLVTLKSCISDVDDNTLGTDAVVSVATA